MPYYVFKNGKPVSCTLEEARKVGGPGMVQQVWCDRVGDKVVRTIFKNYCASDTTKVFRTRCFNINDDDDTTSLHTNDIDEARRNHTTLVNSYLHGLGDHTHPAPGADTPTNEPAKRKRMIEL